MSVIYLRFYAELNQFLPPHLRQVPFPHPFREGNTVKHAIEAAGVPHTEVDLVLVNGESRPFDYHLLAGDQVSIYPVFESFDISSLVNLRPEPLRVIKFILDAHLGKLSTYLRMMGFDTLYQNDYADDELALIAMDERRILLTRDIELLKRKNLSHGHYVRAIQPRRQLLEVMQRYQLFNIIQPFSRCLLCNGLLKPTPKESIDPVVIFKARNYYDEFYICQSCHQVYWKGSHYLNMLNLIQWIISNQNREYNQA